MTSPFDANAATSRDEFLARLQIALHQESSVKDAVDRVEREMKDRGGSPLANAAKRQELGLVTHASRKRHRCSPPGWWMRRKLDVDFGSVWACACGEKWEWRCLCPGGDEWVRV